MSGNLTGYTVYSAALCAVAFAGWLMPARRHGPRRARRLASGQRQPQSGTRPRVPSRPRWGAARQARWLGGGASLVGGALLGIAAGSPLPLLAAPLVAPLVARWHHGRAQLRVTSQRREAVIAFCVALAGEVRAGRQPAQALLTSGVAGLGPDADGVLAAARYGGDVPASLRRTAAAPGASGLHGVAACWQAAVDAGASLAAGLDRVAQSLRTERDQREDLLVQLAGPRATARMLAALPLTGPLLGGVMGAQPLRVLFHTPAGLSCLLLGLLLETAGLLWSGAIIRSAERSAA